MQARTLEKHSIQRRHSALAYMSPSSFERKIPHNYVRLFGGTPIFKF
ncbi:hypothetical protein LEP1GSC171_0522 [Leptospira santarosai str. HAI1380]|uniref:Uncharacterized protein n=2 Tax=Leptospira santarosai TaxID=28183 RepID=M6V451_9LEPT|nr:hypothetical protein LEP1GSC179_2269 [Leptospira santarosai str. MOR084]EKO79113.1 hypothetical protein LEP1GSC068_4102 [Leptospira sp. Fiocruz LV3954]EKR90011.1 hypothetical protein LEP1GSC163_1553 [Leptospira santarosai str. CBC379]EKS09408.1 hypothetical protein LEP1GSC071_3739 [Leptospira santarosai str. JET]EMF90491.1 hypothetical protein LEP1GSC005_0549 [Leptospira santarosai str. ST188]EMI65381.1 hypothetical protein LEP1GSC076_2841 [Leptospira sp. Fiocruz LV4135]EMO15000.1 hypothet